MKRYITIFITVITLIFINVTNVNAASTSFNIRYVNGSSSNVSTTTISLLQCNNGIDVNVTQLSQGASLVFSSNAFNQSQVVNSTGIYHISILPASINTTITIMLIPNSSLPVSYASGSIQKS